MKKPKKPDHRVCGHNSFRCLNCGEELFLPISSKGGYSFDMFVAVSKAFGKEHKSCKPSEAGKRRFEYTNVAEWLKSWDTGISSLTMCAVLGDRGCMPSRPGAPSDPSDFGRCYRLLRLLRSGKEYMLDLHELSKQFPEWAPIIEAWPELEALYEEELKRPDGLMSKLYARMQELR